MCRRQYQRVYSKRGKGLRRKVTRQVEVPSNWLSYLLKHNFPPGEEVHVTSGNISPLFIHVLLKSIIKLMNLYLPLGEHFVRNDASHVMGDLQPWRSRPPTCPSEWIKCAHGGHGMWLFCWSANFILSCVNIHMLRYGLCVILEIHLLSSASAICAHCWIKLYLLTTHSQDATLCLPLMA